MESAGPTSTNPSRICAWCDQVLEMGDEHVSHGICDACQQSFFRSISRLMARP